MTLKAALKNRPVIYEIVPPRRDTSRYNTELRGVEEVLSDSRIAAINIPELMTRRKQSGRVHYSPTTIPPEEYALMIRDYKEPIVNVIAPRLTKEDFQRRARRVMDDYGVHDFIVVGKERHGDVLPGPGVVEALHMIDAGRSDDLALGGICIFTRESSEASEYASGSRLTEAKRVWAKARAGCDFVTSQICFDPKPALNFLSSYSRICEGTGEDPLTVFVSLATVPTPGILTLMEGLDVVIPPKVKRRIANSHDMGAESLEVAAEVFEEIISVSEERGEGVPLGLQVEQVGVNSGALSLELLDRVYPVLRSS